MQEQTALTGRVRGLLDAAERDLLAAAGNLSLCAIAKSGEPFGAAKYHEGRAAALSALLRSLRHNDLPDALEHTLRRFDTASGPGGPDWEAYRQGARDALAGAEGGTG